MLETGISQALLTDTADGLPAALAQRRRGGCENRPMARGKKVVWKPRDEQGRNQESDILLCHTRSSTNNDP